MPIGLVAVAYGRPRSAGGV